jgi:hypothetical protein
VKLLTVDRDALPALLLPEVKAQMRVRHARDDGLISTHIAMAISAVERKGNVSINPAEYEIAIHHLRGCAYPGSSESVRWRLPVNNATEIVSLKDAAGVDAAAAYSLEQADQGGNADSYLVGPPIYGSGYSLRVKVGMATTAAIDRALLSLVYRISGAYYEARESFSPVYVDDFMGELVAAWRPAV